MTRVLYEIGVEKHDGDVDFRPEVEIWPFCACAMKNMHRSASLRISGCRNYEVFWVLKIEIYYVELLFFRFCSTETEPHLQRFLCSKNSKSVFVPARSYAADPTTALHYNSPLTGFETAALRAVQGKERGRKRREWKRRVRGNANEKQARIQELPLGGIPSFPSPPSLFFPFSSPSLFFPSPLLEVGPLESS